MGGHRNSMDLTLLTCNYNTPNLVLNLLKSVKNTCSEIPNVMIMDTSTETSSVLDENRIPYFSFRGGTHGEAVNLAFKKIQTKNVLLVDSDVIFLEDFKKPFEKFKSMDLTLMGKVVGDCAGKSLYPRVEPWYCFINLENLKRHKIRFFDRERTRQSKLDAIRVYDIGSTMFEDVSNKNLKIGDVSMEGKYFKHYGGMSWHVQKFNSNDKDTDIDFGGTHPNESLRNYGLHKRVEYLKETAHLENISLTDFQ